jgi:hypothetical protein
MNVINIYIEPKLILIIYKMDFCLNEFISPM